MTFPTADEIATAVVMAARFVDEDPLAVLGGERSRARTLAMAALLEAFPKARRIGLGECLGYRVPRSAQASVITGRKSSGWREERVDEIVGALVAPHYGEQAA